MKTIIITGASRGIGFETAKYLASKNNRVIAIARSGDALNKLKDLNPELIHIIKADLNESAQCSAILSYCTENKVQIDGVINNAGLLIAAPFTELSDSHWLAMIETNLLAPVRLVRTVIPLMKQGSHIVNISSMGGFQGSSKFPGLSGYSASKGALSILTECLAAELGSKKIASNCLCLGAVQTEMLEQAFPGFEAPVSASEMGAYVGDFTLNAHRFYNGKILPVTLADPG